MIDPIIKEIHKIRAEYAEKFDFDIDAIFEDLQKKQLANEHKIVSFVEDKEPQKSDDDKKAA